jgi:putative intracellular protease/amidase
LDPVSIELFKKDALSVDFYANKKFLWEETTPLKQFLGRSSEFVALLYPGGHGPMFDLVQDEDSIRLIEEFITADKPVAAICHGPISFINVIVNGQTLAKGRRLTGYSNDEESAAKRTSLLPFLLEDELKKKGAKYEKAAVLLRPKVVIDGKIITGQNPASAKGVAEALAKAIAG